MTATQPRPFRVAITKPDGKKIDYRFSCKGGRATNFLKQRHPIRLVTSPVEADLVDGGGMTTYGATLAELGLIPEEEPPTGPEFLALHVPPPVEEAKAAETLPAGPVEETVADCIDPAVLAEVEKPLPEPKGGWTRSKVRKLRLDDLHKLAWQLGAELPEDMGKAEARAAVLTQLGL